MFWSEGDVRLSLVDPTGSNVTPSVAENRSDVAYYSNEEDLQMRGYVLERPRSGSWEVKVNGEAVPSDSVDYLVRTRLEGADISLSASTEQNFYRSGSNIEIHAALSGGGSSFAGTRVTARTTLPDSTTRSLDLYDDGTHGDSNPNDGHYSGIMSETQQAGWYRFAVTAERDSGAVFSREELVEVTVSDSRSVLTGSIGEETSDRDGDGLFDALIVRSEVEVEKSGKYLLRAQLTDSNGGLIDIAAVDTTLESGVHTLPLNFDGRRISGSRQDGPYTVESLTFAEVGSDGSFVVDIAETALKTDAYDADDFERPRDCADRRVQRFWCRHR
jgi:hypothetical protein